MAAIAVRCQADPSAGWACLVAVRENGVDVSTHRVRVRADQLERLAPGVTDPAPLVEESFRFLLERESARTILRSFDLLDIARYFPEYETEIRRRMGEPG